MLRFHLVRCILRARLALLTLAAVASCVLPALAAKPSFRWLDVPSWQVQSSVSTTAVALSGDGKVVVGLSGERAFRWTAATGMEDIGDLPGGDTFAGAWDVSFDGSVVVGGSKTEHGIQPFRWSSASGMESLPVDSPTSSAASWAFGTSGDGDVVVGNSNGGAFRWTREHGTTELGRGEATAASAGGDIVAGYLHTSNGREAFRWTEDGGMDLLGQLPGRDRGPGAYSNALDLSLDGSVIVGEGATRDGGIEAFRWTAEHGMVGLGDFPGGALTSTANAISADGSLIVGHGNFGGGSAAAYWHGDNGPKSLQGYFNRLGLEDEIGGVLLDHAIDISADGLTIVGSSQHRQWIATVPEPNSMLLLTLGLTSMAVYRRLSSNRSKR